MDYSQAIRAYLKLRAARSELKARFDAEDEALKQKMALIENVLLQEMRDSSTQAINTTEGTAYISTETRAAVADWPAFLDWAMQRNATEFFEQRVRRSAVENFFEETGSLPPGVNLSREYVIRVRKS